MAWNGVSLFWCSLNSLSIVVIYALVFIQQQIDSRDAVIRCLIHFLGESTEELIKDYQVYVCPTPFTMAAAGCVGCAAFDHYGTFVLCLAGCFQGCHRTRHQRQCDQDPCAGQCCRGCPPTDVIIVIDGTEVLGGCKTLTNACILLMGFVYSLNLSYPPKLKYTFEVFQKLLLELDDLKFSPKVDSLRRKLLM